MKYYLLLVVGLHINTRDKTVNVGAMVPNK